MEKNNSYLASSIELYSSRFIYYTLILIPFVASFSSAAVNIFVGLSILGFLIKKIAKKEFWLSKTVISLPFLCILLFSLLTFASSVSIRASLEGMAKLLKYGFLFIIIAEEAKDERHLRRMSWAIILGLCLASLDGIYQLSFGKDFFRNKPFDVAIGLPRLKAAFPHTNIFAAYLALFLPIGMGLTRYYFKSREKVIAFFISALAFFCLIFTFSRGAVAGFFLAIVFMAIVRKDKLILMLLIIALVIAPFILPNNIRSWVKDAGSIWEVLLNKERLNIYKTSLNMIKAHPFLGVGINTYCLNYQKFKIKETEGFTGDAMYYAHNIYLHMAGETGIIGLSLFLWLLFVLFRSWARYYRSVQSGGFLKIYSVCVIASLIAFLFNGITETNLYYPKVAVLFWYQIGLFLALIKLAK